MSIAYSVSSSPYSSPWQRMTTREPLFRLYRRQENAYFGTQDVLKSDKGPYFGSVHFHWYAATVGFKHRKMSPLTVKYRQSHQTNRSCNARIASDRYRWRLLVTNRRFYFTIISVYSRFTKVRMDILVIPN